MSVVKEHIHKQIASKGERRCVAVCGGTMTRSELQRADVSHSLVRSDVLDLIHAPLFSIAVRLSKANICVQTCANVCAGEEPTMRERGRKPAVIRAQLIDSSARAAFFVYWTNLSCRFRIWFFFCIHCAFLRPRLLMNLSRRANAHGIFVYLHSCNVHTCERI